MEKDGKRKRRSGCRCLQVVGVIRDINIIQFCEIITLAHVTQSREFTKGYFRKSGLEGLILPQSIAYILQNSQSHRTSLFIDLC